MALAAMWAAPAGGQQPERPDGQPPGRPREAAAQAPASSAPAAPAEKRVAFEMRDKPWGSVLEWLSDQTGLPVVSAFRPTGTFTFIAPRGKQYTIPEVIDILNEALLAQKYVLIRRAASFTLVPADEKIDPAIVPRILPQELDARGSTEIVSVVLPLTGMVAEDVAPEIKKMLGPFGEVVPLARANQLVLQDTAGNVKRVLKMLKEIEENEKGQAQSFSHTCEYIKARDAERILRELMGDPRELLRALMPQPQQGGGGGPFGQRQPAAPATLPRIRMHYITADERTNSIHVTGPADKVAEAREIVKRIDVPQRGQAPIIVGAPVLKSYTVPGNAEAVAKTLQDIYRASQAIRIAAVGANQVMVWAGPDDQIEIARHILGVTERPAGATELIPLHGVEADKAAELLKGMLGDAKVGGPFVEPDAERNALIVKGTREQVEEVKAVLKVLGEGGGAAGGNVRVITLERGSAAALADALERLLTQMRQNPVRVILPGAAADAPPRRMPPAERNGGDEEQEPPDAAPPQGADAPRAPAAPLRADRNRPGDPRAPVTITAFGNRLVIVSNDPEALALAQELVRLITRTPPGEGDFEIIRLKNASAVQAARVLDEAFNGVRQPQAGAAQQPVPGGGAGGFFGRFAAQGAAPPANPSANRITVVADPATNSLLVRASPLDLLTIRRLLERALDTEEADSRALVRTWVIGPLKDATATEVAAVLRDVYRENVTFTSTSSTTVGFSAFGAGGFGFGRGFGRNLATVTGDPAAAPRGGPLSVGVDDRTNTLVLACSESLYNDIKRLVDQLELAARDANRTVRVVSIKGVDPVLVQQAIDAIQGRRPVTPSTTSPTGRFGTQPSGDRGGFRPDGGGGFVPFGTGGFVPGTGPGMAPAPGGGDGRGGGGFRGGRGGGGGGSRGNRGGGGRTSALPRGPDFFAQRVTDDPQPPRLYDPDQAPPPADNAIRPVRYEEQQPPPAPPPAGPPAPPDTVRGPRSNVTAEALEELGVIVISGNNPADVEEVVRIIEYIQKLGAGAEVAVQLVPLEHADATSVGNTLTQLFQAVIFGPTGNVRNPQAPGAAPATAPAPGAAGAAAQTAAAAAAASVVLLPLPRFNALLVAAPRARVDDVVKEIKRLDRPPAGIAGATPFPLKKASAARVATLIQQFYAQRYPNETAAQNQVRVTVDESSNTVFVQAAPGDLAEIRALITRIDSTVSSAVNDLRVVQLKNTVAAELAAVLQQAILDGVAPASPTAAPSIVPAAPPAAAAPGAAPAAPGVPPAAAPRTPTTGASTKTTTLRFISGRRDGPGAVQAGMLEDVFVLSEARTNSLVLSAPPQTMELLLALVRELDVPSALRSRVNIFTLKRADAAVTAATLQQLFFGGAARAGAAGAAPGALGAAAAPGAAALPGAGVGAAGAALAVTRPVFTLGDVSPEGTPLIALRFTVDDRTNSLIVAGSDNDLRVIEAIISRLEDSDTEVRQNEVFKLHNAAAADVATALQNFWTRSLQVLSVAQQLSAYQEIQRDVVVVAEPVSNTLLVSATPRYFADIARLIQGMDCAPAQVVVQVLVAEVDLSNSEEFGVEMGLQSPVLFRRSVVPSPDGFGPSGTVTYSNSGGTLSGTTIPPGVTVNNSINPYANPGLNFLSASVPLGNNPLADPGIVGFQGLSSLGVGRTSSQSNLGGFVFSAQSGVFNLLVRALKLQGRIDVLSRPQLTTLDNQTALINIGQNIPLLGSTTVTGTGLVTQNVVRQNVGVILQVTPRISPDGTVIMRVVPEVSSVAPNNPATGNGTFGATLNIQHLETTVLARDGETVAIGGLITKSESRNENKVPVLGELPWVGPLFRYRTQYRTKTELLIILTPHIVRSAADADRILAAEARRMDWILGDVVKTHGTTGLEPIFPWADPAAPPPAAAPAAAPPAAPAVIPEEPAPTLPPPTPLPGPALPPAPGPGRSGPVPPSATDPVSVAPRPAPAVVPVEWTSAPKTPGRPGRQ